MKNININVREAHIDNIIIEDANGLVSVGQDKENNDLYEVFGEQVSKVEGFDEEEPMSYKEVKVKVRRFNYTYKNNMYHFDIEEMSDRYVIIISKNQSDFAYKAMTVMKYVFQFGTDPYEEIMGLADSLIKKYRVMEKQFKQVEKEVL